MEEVIVRSWHADGVSVNDIADHFDVTPSAVYYLLRNGYGEGQGGTAPTFSREAAQTLRDRGHTLRQIAYAMGVSPQRVHQVTTSPASVATRVQAAAIQREAKKRAAR
jgi:predicted transcriptional regulator